MNFSGSFFSYGPFMPHGGCYLWTQSLIALHVISDALIVLSYYFIPCLLFYFVRKRDDLKFHWMFICFAVFILACGTTHLLEIWNIWHANYWLSGGIKAITALASVTTAILLWKLIPRMLALPSSDALQKSRDEMEFRVVQRTAELELAAGNLKSEIRERKEAEGKVRQLNIELEHRVVTRTSQLQLANEELEAFSYSVSHDLRAPLRHVLGFVTLLQKESEGLLSEKGHGHLIKISQAAKRMGHLIDDLLSFARIGKSEMQKTNVELDQMIREILDEIEHDIKGRSILWELSPLPPIWADRSLLQLALVNLVSNAVKFTQARTQAKIHIGCFSNREGETVIFIRDNGAGFDQRYACKLFGVFQRLHSQDKFEGTGIGLANVRRIIQRHGGRVWAEGAVDAGATFYFSVPNKPLRPDDF